MLNSTYAIAHADHYLPVRRDACSDVNRFFDARENDAFREQLAASLALYDCGSVLSLILIVCRSHNLSFGLVSRRSHLIFVVTVTQQPYYPCYF